jgi:hypothetical protein
MAENVRGLRVLVVEDELLIRWSIAETLAQGVRHVLQKPFEMQDLESWLRGGVQLQ